MDSSKITWKFDFPSISKMINTSLTSIKANLGCNRTIRKIFMWELDNSAARLYRLLKAGREFSGEDSCYLVWTKILATDDKILLMARLGRVMALIGDTVQELRQICPAQENSWSHWVLNVNEAFMAINMKGDWNSFNGVIDNHTINYLGFAAEILQRNRSMTIKIAARKDIVLYKKKLNAAMVDLLRCGQPLQVSHALKRNIQRVATAMDDYELTGSAVLMDAIQIAAGQVLVDSQYRTFMLETELGQQIQAVLLGAANLVMEDKPLPRLSSTWQRP